MVFCFSCGSELAAASMVAGSPCCHECRPGEASRFRPVERESRRGRPVLTLVQTFPGWAAAPEPPLQPAA